MTSQEFADEVYKRDPKATHAIQRIDSKQYVVSALGKSVTTADCEQGMAALLSIYDEAIDNKIAEHQAEIAKLQDLKGK